MTLNYIWWWGSSSGAVGSVEYLIAQLAGAVEYTDCTSAEG